MKCNTVRPGVNCVFMKAAGCGYEGGSCRPVSEHCVGCERIIKYAGQEHCSSYPDPAEQWADGMCNFATHRKATAATGDVMSTNPLKASKRAAHKK